MGIIRVTEHKRLPPSGISVVYVDGLIPHHALKTKEVASKT